MSDNLDPFQKVQTQTETEKVTSSPTTPKVEHTSAVTDGESVSTKLDNMKTVADKKMDQVKTIAAEKTEQVKQVAEQAAQKVSQEIEPVAKEFGAIRDQVSQQIKTPLSIKLLAATATGLCIGILILFVMGILSGSGNPTVPAWIFGIIVLQIADALTDFTQKTQSFFYRILSEKL